MKLWLHTISLSLVMSGCSTGSPEEDQANLDSARRNGPSKDAGRADDAANTNPPSTPSDDAGSLDPQGNGAQQDPPAAPNTTVSDAGSANVNVVCGNGNIVSDGDTTIVGDITGDGHVISGRDTVGAGCVNQNSVVGDGNLITETRSVGSFQGLQVGQQFHVVLKVGSPSLVLEMDSNLIKLVDTVVTNGTLQIKSAQPNTALLPSAKARIVVTAPSLNNIDSSGAASVSGPVVGQPLTLTGSGGSKLDVEVSGNQELDVDASGKSAVNVSGAGDLLRADVSGAGSLTSAIAYRAVELTASGTSKTSVRATTSATVEATGASRVEVAGSPAERDVDASPGARVLFL